MAIAPRLINVANRLMTKFNATDRVVYKRLKSRSGGDPLTGVGVEVSAVDTLCVPQPIVLLWAGATERRTRGRAERLDVGGIIGEVGDYMMTLTPTIATSDELRNPDLSFVFKDDSLEEEFFVVGDEPVSLEGQAVLHTILVRSKKGDTVIHSARYTFLHFLADNLPPSVEVHPIRLESSDPGANTLKMNSVNVQFLGLNLDVSECTQMVSIDVVSDDESKVLDWLQAVWDLLKAAFFTPMYDYSNPELPIATGTNVFWDHKKVKFEPVYSDHYNHQTCLLALRFHE